MNPLFPVDLYKQYVIPTLLQIFPSREMHVRICLLQYFASYVDLFDVSVLRKGILPQVGPCLCAVQTVELGRDRSSRPDEFWPIAGLDLRSDRRTRFRLTNCV